MGLVDNHANMVAFLQSDPAVAAIVGTRIHANYVPQDIRKPYIWFRRRAALPDECTDRDPGALFQEEFDLEMHADEPGELYADNGLVRAVTMALDMHSGTFGSGQVNVIQVTDQDDEYIVRGDSGDDGTYVETIAVMVENTL